MIELMRVVIAGKISRLKNVLIESGAYTVTKWWYL